VIRVKSRFFAVSSATLLIALAAAPVAGAAARPTVKLANTALGPILVSGSGRTLYAFGRDRRNKDRCVTISGCTGIWPVLALKGKLTPGPGIKGGLLGTIRLSSGRRQVTYAGHPLYLYSGDTGPHQTDYVGISEFGGVWSALNSAGGKVI
jgi:predicted lipoprotein with Yx(FWY)xxD motif